MSLRTSLIVLFTVTIWLQLASAQESENSKHKTESPSPDGRFAFRYKAAAPPESDSQEDNEADKNYELIDKRSGKALKTVVESNAEIGPSARFNIEAVRWRANSSAFAIKAFLWKRGSSVFIFLRDGSSFRRIELPEIDADIPEKVRRGRSFPHVNELNSQTAKRWQKDSSLVVEIETIIDGNDEGLMATATRTVVLGFDRSNKAKILKSTLKSVVEKQ